jgi:tetratricopeptide (TPR) repeat protein
MQQENCDHDYTHSILVECVLNDPGNLTYVETMLLNLQKKYRNNKRGAWLKSFGGRGALKKAATQQDWPAVFRLAPALLRKNPWDVAVLRSLADACAASGFADVELRYLKNALDANPKDAAVNRHCALSLARTGQYDQAIACWNRVDEIKRGDDEAQKMISELQIEKTRHRGKPGTEGHRHPLPRPALPADGEESSRPRTDEASHRELRLTPRQQLEQDVANHPTDLEAYFSLARLHVEETRFGEAIHVLNKALIVSGQSVIAQEQLEDVEVLRKKRQLADAEHRADAQPTEEHKQHAAALRAELLQFEWEVFQRRSERHPQDLEIKYQLALRLKELDRHREAIPFLEAAAKLPERRILASLELGDCWQRLKQYSKALEQFSRAAERAGNKQLDAQQLALYRAGVLAAGLHNLELAESLFSKLVSLDSGYKDASARLDKIREIRHKG